MTEVYRAGLILDIGEGSAPNLRHFPGCRRVPGTCQSDFREDFFFFMFSIVFNTFIKKGKNEYIFKENPKMKVGALLKIYNLRYYRSFLTEKCLCYNQKRKFFALSFTLWWCRNIKEKLWNWLTYPGGWILDPHTVSDPSLRHFPACTSLAPGRPIHATVIFVRTSKVSDFPLFPILWLQKAKMNISSKKTQRRKI